MYKICIWSAEVFFFSFLCHLERQKGKEETGLMPSSVKYMSFKKYKLLSRSIIAFLDYHPKNRGGEFHFLSLSMTESFIFLIN